MCDFKYSVTFNSGEYGVGDEHESDVDYFGNNLEELIDEVLQNEKGDKLAFWKVNKIYEKPCVGVFAEEADDTKGAIAVLYET